MQRSESKQRTPRDGEEIVDPQGSGFWAVGAVIKDRGMGSSSDSATYNPSYTGQASHRL